MDYGAKVQNININIYKLRCILLQWHRIVFGVFRLEFIQAVVCFTLFDKGLKTTN